MMPNRKLAIIAAVVAAPLLLPARNGYCGLGVPQPMGGLSAQRVGGG